MSRISPDTDPDGLLEYSVVFSDRSLNHMSQAFQQVMRDISSTLRQVYGAAGVAVVPGGGTYGMEAVARRFGSGRHCMVLRNGWFSYRWTQILEMGGIPSESTVLKARPIHAGRQSPFVPAPIDEVVGAIHELRPAVIFAPHVETASGILLPGDYIRTVADAVHEVGGLMVLDCIASGTDWIDLRESGTDVLISAPQKGWSASPCAALVMLSEMAMQRLPETRSSSYACDLLKWLQIMQAYESGGHAYHATLPTDALVRFRDAMQETGELGFNTVRELQRKLGERVRALLAEHAYISVAARGFEAPGVIVCYTDDPDVHNGRKFAAAGLQTAAGVPLMCGEPEDFRTFRIGLFGLDKLLHVERTVETLSQALQKVESA